ncbi:MAG: glycosyltransferase [Acutalibacteraceae bacterium]
MRNVATHLAKCLEEKHKVVYSSLKDIMSIIINSKKSDLTVICVRLNAKTYYIAKLARTLCKKVYIIAVQRPQADFLKKIKRKPLRCEYFTITSDDKESLKAIEGTVVRKLYIGINKEKFSPVSEKTAEGLRKKYGFLPDKPLVIHVGHCSEGRGLEDFSVINKEEYSTLIIASGMFESQHVISYLKKAGVNIRTGYLSEINEIYQMADCYLFPTRSSEYVISIPLSAMEALSCGVPVVAYDCFGGIKEIQVKENAVIYVSKADEIPLAIKKALTGKSEKSLLLNPKSWSEAAEDFIGHFGE